MGLSRRWNRSAFGTWIQTSWGRRFRALAGVGFAVIGLVFWGTPGGTAALLWSVFPLSAGLFDLCWISAALGGPFRGAACRAEASAG
jgi:hypothetical protein